MFKNSSLGLRLRSDIKQAAMKAAADDARSLSSLIEKLLFDYLKEKNYLT